MARAWKSLVDYKWHKDSKTLVKMLKEVEDLPTRRDKVTRAARAGALIVEEEARFRAPRDTGTAAGTIRARVLTAKPGFAHLVIGPSSRGYYLMYQEFGTRHMPGKKFLRGAYDDKKQEAVQAMADEYWRIIDWARQRRASR